MKSAEEYRSIAVKHYCRFVNYQNILDGLKSGQKPEEMGEFLKKEKKVYNDPVIDPRETWSEWASRVAEFKEAPLV